jgi:hypothetical protein
VNLLKREERIGEHDEELLDTEAEAVEEVGEDDDDSRIEEI